MEVGVFESYLGSSRLYGHTVYNVDNSDDPDFIDEPPKPDKVPP